MTMNWMRIVKSIKLLSDDDGELDKISMVLEFVLPRE